MANRWERGKLGPYTLPQDFKEGGVALNGINNVKPKEESFLVPPSTLVYFNDPSLITEESNVVCPSGQSLSRSTYSALFDVVGELYGSGDGSSTFDVPNLTYTASRAAGTPAASGVGQFQVGTMWDHTHSVNRTTAEGKLNASTVTAPQPIVVEAAISVPTAGPVSPLSQTGINAGPYTVPNPAVIPQIGPLESRYTNSKGIFATRTFKLFPAWTTKATPVPIGSIISFIGNDDLTPFEGYLLCNGQSVDGATYPLAAALGITATQDLRGYFLAGISEEEVSRSAQTSVSAHRHRFATTPGEGSILFSPLITTGSFNIATARPQGSSNLFYPGAYNTTSTSLGPGNETRPVNMSVNFFMRVG